MNDQSDSPFSPVVLFAAAIAFSYGGSLIVRQAGSISYGTRWEHVEGWPAILYGSMIVIVVGVVLAQKWLKHSGAPPTTRNSVMAIGYATVIGWGVLRFMGIA